ncbi:MAG: type II toxin-antitoxin system RelE/ParE family toxin [Pseudomonadota bacterium]
MGYKLSVAAENDIQQIAEIGIELFGIEQAWHYHEALFEIFDLLADNPRMARERFEISPPVRIHPYKAHLIVYTVDEQDDILIVRVRHGHEDWATPAQ